MECWDFEYLKMLMQRYYVFGACKAGLVTKIICNTARNDF